MADIFISYRVVDTGPYAQRLADHLETKLKQEGKLEQITVFLDGKIEPGDRWVDKILEELDKCKVALILIGSQWLTVTYPNGTRRLRDPADLVHREVVRALSLGCTVVPVLFDGALLPTAEELPEALSPLVELQQWDIHGVRHFKRDADDLADRIRVRLAKVANAGPPPQHLIRQLQFSWIALAVVALALYAVPAFSPLIQSDFWIFPASMSTSLLLWWLYIS